MRKIHVAPSILSANMEDIEREVEKVEQAGATFIHLDVMDGLFVPRRTFGPELVKRIAPSCGKMIRDTHLMVQKPKDWVLAFKEAGSQLLTFHYEACDDDVERFACIKAIHDAGMLCGMSIKPATSPDVLVPFLPCLELVLIMSVEPGAGGQVFMPSALEKIAFCRKKIDALPKSIYLEVDGGINETTGKLCVEAGADVLVAGSYIYGHDDYEERIRRLQR